jgi:TRAP-type C4-dicarboxylate transport system substrate-binding protein
MAMTRTLLLGALLATAALFGGCLGGDDSNKAGEDQRPHAVVLSFATHGPDTLDLDEFAREVSRQSNGSVRIEFEKRWREGERDYQQRTIDDVREAKVDLANVPARAFDLAGVDSLQPLVAPFAVDSYALERRVLGSPLAARMLRGVEQIDLVGVAVLPGELRKPLGVSRQLVDASDYAGATIGTRSSELGARALRALGANPGYYEPGQDISSFDGIEAGLTDIEGDRYDGPARTLAANVNLWPRALAIVMNRGAYGRLSDDQRDALRAAGRSALDPAMKRVEHEEAEALGVLCNRAEVAFRSASPSQLDALRAATRPVAEALDRNPATRGVARAIAAMRGDVEPEKAPTCTTENEERAAEGATPVDGLWQMETTAEELLQATTEGEVAPENWGKQTFAMVSGRFAFTNENREACIWGYGRYAVKTDILEFKFEDGGGDAPTDAANRPGEFFRYHWSRYRDQLTLKPVKGAISPGNFRVKAWRLLEGEPSLGGLSRRCPPPIKGLQP